VRRRLTARLLRPGASDWLRESLVAGAVALREGCAVEGVRATDAGLELRLGDGAELTVDRVIVATGYAFALDRLTFLAPELRDTIAVEDDWPVLDRWFTSTNPGISFLGYPAEGSFGPVARFVLGVPFTVTRLASREKQR
jgi:pyruvate/2-oxoglutarate dehydrogenase complex dihydrolipoamide dehydrogenase (E3) component